MQICKNKSRVENIFSLSPYNATREISNILKQKLVLQKSGSLSIIKIESGYVCILFRYLVMCI